MANKNKKEINPLKKNYEQCLKRGGWIAYVVDPDTGEPLKLLSPNFWKSRVYAEEDAADYVAKHPKGQKPIRIRQLKPRVQHRINNAALIHDPNVREPLEDLGYDTLLLLNDAVLDYIPVLIRKFLRDEWKQTGQNPREHS